MELSLIITLVVSYLLGSIPFGYLVARAKGVNIFEVGSKSPGATNVKRVLGSGPGNLVFALDFIKGVIAVVIPLVFQVGGEFGSLGYDLSGVAGVFGAVLGHSFSCFTGFRGGKGVATAGGGLFVLMPVPCLVALAGWGGTFLISKYVSLASLVAAAIIAVLPWFMGFSIVIQVMASALGLLVIARHHANITRLMAGTEHRWDRK
jgi:acyl phosphate:glycerol-3-phosphate acyltransferase